MKYRFKNVYLTHRPMRIATYIFLTGLCALLVWGAGGIPPVSWPILACLLLRAWATVLHYSWSTKQQFLPVPPTFADWQRQQSYAVVSTSLHTDMDMYNATTDAFLLSDLSPSVTTSGRHPAIHIPTPPNNGGPQVGAPPFPPMPVPVPQPSTPPQKSSHSPFWTFDSISYP